MSRKRLDFYETPVWQTDALRRRVEIHGKILEPCVGDGAIAMLFKDCEVLTNDFDPAREAKTHFDARKPDLWKEVKSCDWIITNPPFNSAFEILEHAAKMPCFGVIMLMRLSFLEPTKERSGYLAKFPPTRQIVLPRWSYTGDGNTDSVTTAWFIWSSHVRPGIAIVPREEMEAKDPDLFATAEAGR